MIIKILNSKKHIPNPKQRIPNLHLGLLFSYLFLLFLYLKLLSLSLLQTLLCDLWCLGHSQLPYLCCLTFQSVPISNIPKETREYSLDPSTKPPPPSSFFQAKFLKLELSSWALSTPTNLQIFTPRSTRFLIVIAAIWYTKVSHKKKINPPPPLLLFRVQTHHYCLFSFFSSIFLSIYTYHPIQRIFIPPHLFILLLLLPLPSAKHINLPFQIYHHQS